MFRSLHRFQAFSGTCRLLCCNLDSIKAAESLPKTRKLESPPAPSSSYWMAADPAPRSWRRLTSDALVPSSSKAQAAGRPGSGAPRDTAPLKLGLRVDVGAGEDAATPGGDSQPGSAIRAYVPPFSLLPSPAAGDAALGSGAGSRPVQPGSSCPASRPWCSPPARRSSSPRRSSINSPPPGMAPLPDLKRLQPLRPPPPAPLGAAAHTFGCSGSSPGGSSPAAALQRMPQQLFKLPPEQERAHRYERLL